MSWIPKQARAIGMFLGVFFVFVGILLLLANYGIISIDWVKIWPIFFVFVGFGFLVVSWTQ